MNKEKGRVFTITDNMGKTVQYEILFTFDSEETKKSYIVFTDIETEKEWNLIETLLAQIEDKIGE